MSCLHEAKMEFEKGPTFQRSQRYRETSTPRASCHKGDREVPERRKCLFLGKMSGRELIGREVKIFLPQGSFKRDRFLHTSASSDFGLQGADPQDKS